MMRKRIAVIDFLFSWPPDSGARIDLKEILVRLQKDYEVILFILDYSKRGFAGNIHDKIPIPLKVISTDKKDYHSHKFLREIKRQVLQFNPHCVFIADCWHIKPYLVEMLKDYPIFLRFYCYETLCLKNNGVFIYRHNICNRNHLISKKDFFFCQWCSLSSMVRHRRGYFGDEYLAARAYRSSYSGLVKNMFRHVKAVGCYNKFIAERIKPWNKNVHILPSGVDVKKYFLQPEKKQDKKIVLFTGRAYDFFKGFHTLLAAGRILYKKRRDFYIVATNEGKGKKENFWELIPWRRPSELPALYRESHICVVPSLWREPFGMVAVEAMASGRPVVASKVGGLQNIITDGEDGFLVKPGDADDLSQKIEDLLDNSDLRREMGRKGRQKVENFFSWDKIYQNHYIQLFEKLCQN